MCLLGLINFGIFKRFICCRRFLLTGIISIDFVLSSSFDSISDSSSSDSSLQTSIEYIICYNYIIYFIILLINIKFKNKNERKL